MGLFLLRWYRALKVNPGFKFWCNLEFSLHNSMTNLNLVSRPHSFPHPKTPFPIPQRNLIRNYYRGEDDCRLNTLTEKADHHSPMNSSKNSDRSSPSNSYNTRNSYKFNPKRLKTDPGLRNSASSDRNDGFHAKSSVMQGRTSVKFQSNHFQPQEFNAKTHHQSNSSSLPSIPNPQKFESRDAFGSGTNDSYHLNPTLGNPNHGSEFVNFDSAKSRPTTSSSTEMTSSSSNRRKSSSMDCDSNDIQFFKKTFRLSVSNGSNPINVKSGTEEFHGSHEYNSTFGSDAAMEPVSTELNQTKRNETNSNSISLSSSSSNPNLPLDFPDTSIDTSAGILAYNPKESESKKSEVMEISTSDPDGGREVKKKFIEGLEDGEMPIVRFEDAENYESLTPNGGNRDLSDAIGVLSPVKEKGIMVIDNVDSAEKLVDILINKFKDKEFACDTEVCGIDMNTQTPLAHGKLVCFSLYCGPNQDIYHGFSRIWVDTLDKPDVLFRFKPFFEDPAIKKIWHNYSFDRHVFTHAGIHVAGFHADTMHMARLWDSSRLGGKQNYSLESLTSDRNVMNGNNHVWIEENVWPAKISLKELFSRPKRKKNGDVGKIQEIPPIGEIQTHEQTKNKWIHYSAYDSVSTWILNYSLTEKLKGMAWKCDVTRESGTMLDFYANYWRPFAVVLADMEEYGIRVDRDYLADLERHAFIEMKLAENVFRRWAAERCEDAKWMNVNSDPQIRQLLFAGKDNRKDRNQKIPEEKTFKVTVDSNSCELENTKEKNKAVKKEITLRGLGPDIIPKTYTSTGWPSVSGDVIKELAGKITFDMSLHAIDDNEGNDDLDETKEKTIRLDEEKMDENLIEDSDKRISKNQMNGKLDGTLHISQNQSDPIPVTGYIHGKLTCHDSYPNQVKDDNIKIVSGLNVDELNSRVKKRKASDHYEVDVNKYGTAYQAFGEGIAGKKACYAFSALCEMNSISILLTNFICPLQGTDIIGVDNRVHCSININTETGRLSARKPSLQNQPSGEKDRYKIRKAFVAEKGNSLIVADYGQLELRILAHLAKCKSMLEAFKLGGDFHSRTALNMYEHVRKAVADGEVILEWNQSPGNEKPPVPLLKDKFKSERQKAKMLNFSIAYGKTRKGLAKDWKVSENEAQATLNLWYSDRPEVKIWQEMRIEEANKTKRVHTLLGRSRHFPKMNTKISNDKKYLQSHWERASINTPVQGSAADITMLAMLEITKNQRLKQLGWKLLLQVHDEVILEGPAENESEALQLVKNCMQNPFDGKNLLLVDLVVDAKSAKTWYEAK